MGSRLAAIMFTDIAAYSRMMEEDEPRTIRVLHAHNDVVLPIVAAHSGEVVDTIGDALFVMFPSVQNAVQCALDVHQAVATHNSAEGQDLRFQLRIGIHLGEVLEEDGRIYGNGVNIAARVQPLAQPGGLCITEYAYQQVRSKMRLDAESIGRPQLRNISRPIEVFRVRTGVELREERTLPAPASGAKKAGSREDALGALAEAKEQILREKENVTQKLESDGGSPRMEHSIESSVLTMVDRIMDKAIEKIEDMEPELDASGEKLVVRSKKSGKAVTINIGDGKVGKAELDVSGGEERDSGQIRRAAQTMAPPFVLGGLSTFLYFQNGSNFWLILAVFSGFAFLTRVGALLRAVQKRGEERRNRPRILERNIIKVAAQRGGSVTVVQLAHDLNEDTATLQGALDALAARGHIRSDIDSDGVMHYSFPELLQPGS